MQRWKSNLNYVKNISTPMKTSVQTGFCYLLKDAVDIVLSFWNDINLIMCERG